MRLDDEIQYVTASNANENVGATQRIGSEVALTLTPVSFLEITGGYSWVDARFATGANDGKRIPLVPSHSADGTVTVTPLPAFSIGSSLAWRGEAFQSVNEANAQDLVEGFVVTDVFVQFAPAALPGDLSLRAEISNVFDVEYAPIQYWSSFSGNTSVYPAAGRAWSISGAWSY
jgi:outer membrane receptor for ferrienterochelin and colicin